MGRVRSYMGKGTGLDGGGYGVRWREGYVVRWGLG